MSVKIVCAIYFAGLFFLFVPDTHGKTCWNSTWYNRSHPAELNGSDSETLTIKELNAICPDGTPVTTAHCKDEKGEPFTVSKNDSASHFIATCDVQNGLECHPWVTGGLCADFAIQYGCNCPTTTTLHTTSQIVPGASVNISGHAMTENISRGSTRGPGIVTGIQAGGSGSVQGGGINGGVIGGGSTESGKGGISNGSGSTGSSSGSGPGGNSNKIQSVGSTLGSGLSGGNAAFGGSCPCRNGSQKIELTSFLLVLCVLMKLCMV